MVVRDYSKYKAAFTQHSRFLSKETPPPKISPSLLFSFLSWLVKGSHMSEIQDLQTGNQIKESLPCHTHFIALSCLAKQYIKI